MSSAAGAYGTGEYTADGEVDEDLRAPCRSDRRSCFRTPGAVAREQAVGEQTAEIVRQLGGHRRRAAFRGASATRLTFGDLIRPDEVDRLVVTGERRREEREAEPGNEPDGGDDPGGSE